MYLLRGEGKIDARAAVQLEAQILTKTSGSHSVTNKIVLGRLLRIKIIKRRGLKKNSVYIYVYHAELF